MNTMLENLINGNLSTAKNQAKKYTFTRIVNFMKDAGYEETESNNAALYLKGHIEFQEYCNIKGSL